MTKTVFDTQQGALENQISDIAELAETALARASTLSSAGTMPWPTRATGQFSDAVSTPGDSPAGMIATNRKAAASSRSMRLPLVWIALPVHHAAGR